MLVKTCFSQLQRDFTPSYKAFLRNRPGQDEQCYDENNTVVGDCINILNTTLYFNLDFYQAFKQHGLCTKTQKKVAAN